MCGIGVCAENNIVKLMFKDLSYGRRENLNFVARFMIFVMGMIKKSWASQESHKSQFGMV